MPRYKIENGIKIQFTAEEEAQRDIEEQEWNDGAFDRALENLRNKRNNLLKETDYFALSDVSMSDDMTQYRKDLRDLTNGLDTVEKVEAVEFPTKPSGV
jgi:chromosome segregation ATPase